MLAPVAVAATTPTGPVFDAKGRLVQTPLAPATAAARLTKERVLVLFEADPKVRAWLDRYPAKGLVDEETYSSTDSSWTVKIWWG
ncbi:MAG: hypothetical protein QOK22_454, partial [Gaiellaceae bacterium]|nr:hypothetical protein [Gaiellaceae bacterium]